MLAHRDDNQSKCIGELTFKNEVIGVRLRRDRVVVVLNTKVYVYRFSDLKLVDQIPTIHNPKVPTYLLLTNSLMTRTLLRHLSHYVLIHPIMCWQFPGLPKDLFELSCMTCLRALTSRPMIPTWLNSL